VLQQIAHSAMNSSLAYVKYAIIDRHSVQHAKPGYLFRIMDHLRRMVASAIAFTQGWLSSTLPVVKAERRREMHARSESKWISIKHWVECVKRMGSASS
jgi:hypothetical protein